ncbi:MAG: metal-dependent hydrolase, partial [Pseudomonadales bacterium]|nr:metal-dependent hydrolase [Pseudomonadales bacterium]
MNKKVDINRTDATEVSLNSYAETPSDHDLVPRKADFDFGEDINIPRYWQGEAFASRMLDALQLGFPDGERMFIQSVRNYVDDITDPVLKEQVKQFIYQEAQHGIGHTDFTESLVKQGLQVNGVVKLIKSATLAFKKTPRKYQLAATVAAEHMTASLGEFLLSEDDNILKNAHPAMK